MQRLAGLSSRAAAPASAGVAIAPRSLLVGTIRSRYPIGLSRG